jgi:hypothetical protein
VQFPPQDYRPFTEFVILDLNHGIMGCYGIFSASCCIYIGQSRDIQDSMLRHVRGQSSQARCIWLNTPLYWRVITLLEENFAGAVLSLIEEYKPLCHHSS